MYGQIVAMVLAAGAVCLASGCSPGPGTVRAFDFEACAVGQTPPDFVPALTGDGGSVRWVVLEEADAVSGKKILAQTSTDTANYRFPVCVYQRLSARNVDVSVRFKAISGKVDQAGGLVVRYVDKDNYYVVRANALEDNVRLYKVEKGKRIQISGLNTKVTSGQWHVLTLAANGSHLMATFDGQRLDGDDSTFGGAGLAGVWTKADSITHFDDLKIISRD